MGDVDFGSVGLCAALQAGAELVALAGGVGSVENAAIRLRIGSSLIFARFSAQSVPHAGFRDLGFDHEASPCQKSLTTGQTFSGGSGTTSQRSLPDRSIRTLSISGSIAVAPGRGVPLRSAL